MAQTQNTQPDMENPRIPTVPEQSGGVSVEKSIAPERAPEQHFDSASSMPRSALEQRGEVAPVTVSTPAVAPIPQPIQQPKSEVVGKIESILQEDLEDAYFSMQPNQQEAFKVAGEETASKIVTLLAGAKVKVKLLVGLITKWLKMIPGINRYFLEQEAKIKADKILEIKEIQGESTKNNNSI